MGKQERGRREEDGQGTGIGVSEYGVLVGAVLAS